MLAVSEQTRGTELVVSSHPVTPVKISFARLSDQDKCAILARLEFRKERYLSVRQQEFKDPGTIVIVGDRPGPSAPRTALYHHTPFYSTLHCSGWLNSCLHVAQIPESRLVWLNSTDFCGDALSHDVLRAIVDPAQIIAAGGAAAQWLRGGGFSQVSKVPHPQFWKRFKSAERYPLIDLLCSLVEDKTPVKV